MFAQLRRFVRTMTAIAGTACLAGGASAQTCDGWRGPLFPQVRFGHSMVFDEARGVSVLFGGTGTTLSRDYGETWTWNGTDWLRRSTIGPAPRRDQAMAYDSVRSVVVLFGGYGNNQLLGDTLGVEW